MWMGGWCMAKPASRTSWISSDTKSSIQVGLDNCCHAHRSLQSPQEGQVVHRSPAMAAKFTNYIWATLEWLLYPVLGA